MTDLTNGQDLWIVGRFRPHRHKRWEFQGVFDSQAKASHACKTSDYFQFRVGLNVEQPEGRKVVEVLAKHLRAPIILKSGMR